jgi:hypothetical protein
MAVGFCEMVTRGGSLDGHPPTVRKLRNYISVHLHEPINLEELIWMMKPLILPVFCPIVPKVTLPKFFAA